ncbi:MAG: redoxin domain-containing protein [Bdellovibrionota bacterium]
MISKSQLFWDRLFKLVVLVGTPLMGWVYFSQHNDKSVGRVEVIVPFRVDKAPSTEGLKSHNQSQIGNTQIAWSAGTLSVVNFWATWCPPCVEEMPAMAELASRLKPLGVNFYFVSVDEKWPTVLKFLEENIIDIPQESLLWDPSKEVAFRWSSEKFPETYVVNPEGWMIEKIVGFQDWTRPSVISYFEGLAKKNGGELSMKVNKLKTALAHLALAIIPSAYAQDKGVAPLIHEDDKKNLGKLQKNVETANKNVSKIEAAIKEEERSFKEVQIKVQREQRDLDEVTQQLEKVRESLREVDRVKNKNEDSLAAEKLERERVQKEAADLQQKLKELEKELNRTRDQVILTNQKISTRLQNIESFEKALTSSKEELKSLKEREKKLVSNIKKESDVISEMQRDVSKRDSKVKSLESDLKKWNETLDKEKQKLVEFEKLLK